MNWKYYLPSLIVLSVSFCLSIVIFLDKGPRWDFTHAGITYAAETFKVPITLAGTSIVLFSLGLAISRTVRLEYQHNKSREIEFRSSYFEIASEYNDLLENYEPRVNLKRCYKNLFPFHDSDHSQLQRLVKRDIENFLMASNEFHKRPTLGFHVGIDLVFTIKLLYRISDHLYIPRTFISPDIGNYKKSVYHASKVLLHLTEFISNFVEIRFINETHKLREQLIQFSESKTFDTLTDVCYRIRESDAENVNIDFGKMSSAARVFIYCYFLGNLNHKIEFLQKKMTEHELVFASQLREFFDRLLKHNFEELTTLHMEKEFKELRSLAI